MFNYISAKACAELEMELGDDLPVSQTNVTAAAKFGVKFSEGPILYGKYVMKFLRRLLLKQNALQDAKVKTEVVERWQEVLSCLEERKRKLLDIQGQGDKLKFVLFTPSQDSLQQLEDETWKEEIMAKTNHLLKELGM